MLYLYRFGIYKLYPRRPTHDPDAGVTLDDVYEAADVLAPGPQDVELPEHPWYYPFPSATVAYAMKYHIEEQSAGSDAGYDRLWALFRDPEAQEDGVNFGDMPDRKSVV